MLGLLDGRDYILLCPIQDQELGSLLTLLLAQVSLVPFNEPLMARLEDRLGRLGRLRLD